MSSDSISMSAASFSAAAVSSSALAALLSRVCLLVASSALQKAFWSASWLACSISCTIRSLIIFLTLTKGSSATRRDIMARAWLPSSRAFDWRMAAAFLRLAVPPVVGSLRSCAREGGAWTSVGKYFPALPLTSGLFKISTAFSIALTSSIRNTWFSSNILDPESPATRMSASIFSSIALALFTTSRSPLAFAAVSSLRALRAIFSPTVSVSDLMLSLSFCANISKFALAFISSFSKANSWSWNLCRSFSMMATTPPDWDSYAAASGGPWAWSKPAAASISRNDSVTSLAFFGSQSASRTCARDWGTSASLLLST
mmetsp:Transcript_2792/g.6992  ORF Transcript_2792/g.6992 Transcript_2792/m.6992 type:complete len:315 (-) Transcript_2792:395-1339(-)